MLTFRRTNMFLFACLFVLNVSHFFPNTNLSGWWYLVPGLIYFTIISIGSYRVDSNFHFKVICKGDASQNGVALTFDDGPDPLVTPLVLDVLKKNQVTAAFFLIGKKAEANPALVSRIIEEGHIIGNHTYSHSYYFDFFSPKAMAREFLKSQALIKDLTGKSIRWFRPPYGVTNPMMTRALKISKFVPVGWSVRSLDTVIKEKERLFKRLNKTVAGDIVLFHDIRTDMPEIIDEFISLLKTKGLKVVAPESIIVEQAYL